MYRNPIAHSFQNILVVLLPMLFLGGCLVTEEQETAEEDLGDNSGEILKDHELVGSVGDGPIIDADIRVRATDGQSLGTVNSDTGADFAIIVKTRGSYYPLHLEARGGTDLVTSTAPDFPLQSAVLKPGNKTVANLNPFTTFAMELAADMPGGVTEENSVAAIDIVVDELGSGLDKLVAGGPLETEIDAGNIAEMIKASEALGELVRRTRDALQSVGRNVSGDAVVAALGSDLTDGVIDGRGGPRADARMAAVANVVRADVMLEAMPNRLEVQGTDATARMNMAIEQVFDGTPDPAIGDLLVTSGMLEAARIGLLAANAFQPSTTFEQLLSQLEGLAAGMTADQVTSILTIDPGATMDNVAIAVAGASAADLELVNEVARTGEVPQSNSAPQIDGQPATTVMAGSGYSFTPNASDADGDALSFSISGRPVWADFNTSTGTLSGTPGESDVGSNPDIVITVSDGQAQSSLPAFTLTVTSGETNSAPEIGGTPPGSVVAGSLYEFTPTSNDADGDVLTFNVANLPSWASFDDTTGRIAGTPGDSDVGTYGDIVISVSDGQASASLAAFSISVEAPPTGNTPPVISGNPPSSVLANSAYEFAPQASDDDGDPLTFSIAGLPAWASFDTGTGRLYGTPADGDVGVYGDITITVSDGQDNASLGPFEIAVEAVTLGSATLSWTPPTENTDGTALTDLAGYRIYWGTTPGNYTESVELNNPGLTTYVIENLAPAQYEFAVTAVNASGVESDFSNTATKTIP